MGQNGAGHWVGSGSLGNRKVSVSDWDTLVSYGVAVSLASGLKGLSLCVESRLELGDGRNGQAGWKLLPKQKMILSWVRLMAM